MLRCLTTLCFTAVVFVLPSTMFGDSVFPAGYVSLDAAAGGNATFDIYNLTGANSTGTSDAPVTTALNFNDISLTVDYAGGGVATEDASKFASDGNGGYSGQFNIDLAADPIAEAMLTGMFDQTQIALSDGSMASINPDFSATVMPSSGAALQLNDLAVIDAVATPEPAALALCAIGLLALTLLVRRRAEVRHET